MAEGWSKKSVKSQKSGSEVTTNSEVVMQIQKSFVKRKDEIIGNVRDSNLKTPHFTLNPMMISIINGHPKVVDYLLNTIKVDVQSTLKYDVKNQSLKSVLVVLINALIDPANLKK